jgi:para-nitrobenzyl esterase
VEAEQVGMALFTKTKHQTISQLRALHADTLLALGNKLPFGSFFPIRDGYVLPVDANSKPSNDVALLAGWVLGDADLMLRQPKSADAFRAEINSSYPSHVQEFVKLFPSNNDAESKESQRKLALLQFAGMPDYTWATSNKEKSYLYQFSYVPTDKPGFPNYGAFHTSEVPFALHTLDKWDRPWKDEDRAVEKYMSAYWLNFIKNGDPNGAGLPNWTPFTKEQGNVMELGMKPVLKENIFKEEFQLLSKLDEQSRH